MFPIPCWITNSARHSMLVIEKSPNNFYICSLYMWTATTIWANIGSFNVMLSFVVSSHWCILPKSLKVASSRFSKHHRRCPGGYGKIILMDAHTRILQLSLTQATRKKTEYILNTFVDAYCTAIQEWSIAIFLGEIWITWALLPNLRRI